jgi:enoyl-CoA hydratase/carnithine racemase
MADDVLLTSRDSGVLTLTLNRPERKNAINDDLWAALEALMAKTDPVCTGEWAVR